MIITYNHPIFYNKVAVSITSGVYSRLLAFCKLVGDYIKSLTIEIS